MSRPRRQWTTSAIAAALACAIAGACSGTPDRTPSSAPPAAQAAPATPAQPQVSSPPTAGASSDLPPLPTDYAMARPPETVQAAYTFAAQHPEILSHVPCFCGCERRGHKHNDDCFVAGRDAKGRVTEWEPHGMG